MIRMTQTMLGSPDGITVLEYQDGELYPQPGFPLPDPLQRTFVREGWAEEVSPDDGGANPGKALSSTSTDLASLKVADLKALLDEREIAFKPSATKAELLALLEGAAGGES